MAPFTARMGLRDDQARDRIKRWFIKSGMTQQRFADKIGWKQPTMNSFLLGKHNTDLDTLATMAKVFGRSLSDVVATDEVEPDVLTTAFNAVDDDVQHSVLVLLRASKRGARPSGVTRRSLRRRNEEG